MSPEDQAPGDGSRSPAPMGPQLILTFLASIATAIMWNGLGFVAKNDYDFQEWETFLLFAANGLVYAVAAILSGRFLRRIEGLVSPRTVLAVVLVAQGMAAPVVALVDGEWALWATSFLFSICSAGLWSIVESYMSAGRHGHSMRSTIGWWNVTWMTANAIGLASMAVFIGNNVGNEGGRWSIGALGPVCFIAAAMLFWYPRRPVEHVSTGAAEVGTNYGHMLNTCRVMLPLSYVFIGALSSLMPYKLDALGIAATWETPLTATWLVVRVVVVAAMWRLLFWHGRWSSLALAWCLMLVGFGLIAMGPNLGSVLIGLGLVGAGQGMTYYSAIYYALSVGRAEVDAAGTHESLIGLGYGAGPAFGLIGIALGGGAAVGWVVLGAAGLATIPAARPWLRSLRGTGQEN
ncbi:MAG: MFS transporter [Planctomycetota bacterium]|nr:MFS transporter [Planctomycetota bacterium]